MPSFLSNAICVSEICPTTCNRQVKPDKARACRSKFLLGELPMCRKVGHFALKTLGLWIKFDLMTVGITTIFSAEQPVYFRTSRFVASETTVTTVLCRTGSLSQNVCKIQRAKPFFPSNKPQSCIVKTVFFGRKPKVKKFVSPVTWLMSVWFFRTSQIAFRRGKKPWL